MGSVSSARSLLLAAASAAACAASALNVVYDERTPETHRKWADDCFVREQMEAIAPKICNALYEGHSGTNKHENFTITLYPAPISGGNPAFASGKRITWKVGEHPKGDASGGMGCLCHEMTHVLDMGTDSVFTEAMADWTRNYKVWYPRCTSPSHVLDLRYKALCGGRNYGKYLSGAHFVDYMTQTYGEGTIYKILMGYKEHGKNPWEKTFGKSLDALVADWKTMQTIYDPAVQWSYVGSGEWLVRKNNSLVKMPKEGFGLKESSDRAGALVARATSVQLVGDSWSGERTFMLHGRFGTSKGRAVASIGGAGKTVVLATAGGGSLVLAAIAREGSQERCVARAAVPVPAGPYPHSVVVVVRGDVAVALVDGRGGAKLDFRGKCDGCALGRAFAVGGVAGGLLGASLKGEFGDASVPDGIVLDDVRVFNRAARGREAAQYARTYGTSFAPAVATRASWAGGHDGSISDTKSWYCVNSAGERITAVPTEATEVFVSGRALPSIPRGTRFACKSFTVDGWAVAERPVDWRGVKIVDCADWTKLMSKGGLFAVGILRGRNLGIGGHTAPGRVSIDTAAKITGKLTILGGSVLRLPESGANVQVGSLEARGEGLVFLKPGASALKSGERRLVMKVDRLPNDLSRFSLYTSSGEPAGVFEATDGGKSLSVVNARRR